MFLSRPHSGRRPLTHQKRDFVFQEDVPSEPLPPNHKMSSADFSADTNSLVGKQHRFVTAMPPDHDSEMKKYERMMAKLPVRDYPGVYNKTHLQSVFFFGVGGIILI